MSARVLLVTEDSAAEAYGTLEEVLRRLLQHVMAHDRRGVEVEALSPTLRKATRANRWKSGRATDEPAIRDLVRAIARRLEQARTFVVFHVDADVPWEERDRSENVQKFERIIVQRIAALLADKDKPAEHLARLLPLHPHYSIEAWLYQNVRVAVTILDDEGCRCADPCAPKLEAWGEDRALLDEVHKPKEATCLRDRHNLALTRGYPTDEAIGAGKSLAAARARLAACTEIVEALGLHAT